MKKIVIDESNMEITEQVMREHGVELPVQGENILAFSIRKMGPIPPDTRDLLISTGAYTEEQIREAEELASGDRPGTKA